jgi:hypothetical protein
MSPNQKARALAITLISIWASWADGHEDSRDDALRLCAEAVQAIDLAHVCGTIASPLNYFVRAYLLDENPEDLTYDEMMQGMAISLDLPQN